VKKPNLQKPSKVERAKAHLDGAVARLEAVANQRREDAPSGAAPPDDLIHKLEGLRDENVRLKALNETVSVRLDAAIGRIKSVIED